MNGNATFVWIGRGKSSEREWTVAKKQNETKTLFKILFSNAECWKFWFLNEVYKRYKRLKKSSCFELFLLMLKSILKRNSKQLIGYKIYFNNQLQKFFNHVDTHQQMS